MIHVLSTGEVARLLGVPVHRIDYAHATGGLGEPLLRFLGKRVYQAQDVRRVALHFGVTLDEAILKKNQGEEGQCD
jgi:DNA-binding transcriptional MerR regulator